MKTTLMALFAATTVFFHSNALAADAVAEPVEGVDYLVLKTPQKTSAPKGKVEVLEFFWYGCPHCYEFARVSDGWKRADVHHTRIPAVLGVTWKAGALAYYSMVESGGFDEGLHNAIFTAVQKGGSKMREWPEGLRPVLEKSKNSAYANSFVTNYKSFSVDLKVRAGVENAVAYGVSGTPSVVVGGKYVARPAPRSQNDELVYKRMLTTVNFLVDREAKASGVQKRK